MSQPSTSAQNGRSGKRKNPLSEESEQAEVMILKPKRKPPVGLGLVSYPHVDNLGGVLEATRKFSRYFHRAFGQMSNELMAYHSGPETTEEGELPNFAESCRLKVEHEALAIRSLLAGFTARVEKFKPFLQSMPIPPRDVCRKDHPLNGFPIRSIVSGLERYSWLSPIPTTMEFDRETLMRLKDDIEGCDGIRPVLREEESCDPIEDYSDQNGKKPDKITDEGKKILEEKDGVVKMSYASYHLKVMKMLANKGTFGTVFHPYMRKHQKVIYQTIASQWGDKMVEKLTSFLQEAYSAYEAIFAKGKRSIFGPADVEEDVKQHLAQFVHHFKARVSREPLIK